MLKIKSLDLLDNTERFGLFGCDSRAELLAHAADLQVQVPGEPGRRDLDAADLGHDLGLPALAENVANAPNGKAEDQQAKEKSGHNFDE